MAKEDRFYRQILPNGLKVIFEKRDAPIVTIAAATKFGSGHEPANFKGIAHLIEHTVFRKTKTRTSQQITSLIENQGGKIRAFTAEEITAFFAKLRADHFEIGMDVLSDITLNPSFMKRDMDAEKKIILQEINLWHDSPTRHLIVKTFEQLYAPPFGSFGFGTPQTLNNVSRQVIQKYHNIYYSPSNMVMAVVGKAEVDHIWNLSRKYFMKKQVQRQINKKEKIAVAEGPFGSYVEKRRELGQSHIALSYYQPTLQDKLRYAAEIMNNILGEDFSSKLFQQIREKKHLAYHVASSLNQESNYAHGQIYIGAEKSKAESAKKIALIELKKMQKIDAKEVELAKERLIGKYTIESEDSEGVALRILQEELNGDGKEFYKYSVKISEVKLEDVRQVAKIGKIASVMLLPGEN